MARVIAICKDGPLDGVILSVEDREPLHSREDICGVLYSPTTQVELTDELKNLFPNAEHIEAWEYGI